VDTPDGLRQLISKLTDKLLSNVELIQPTNTDDNTIRSCRFATVQTGTLKLPNKPFEKESLVRTVDTPQRIKSLCWWISSDSEGNFAGTPVLDKAVSDSWI